MVIKYRLPHVCLPHSAYLGSKYAVISLLGIHLKDTQSYYKDPCSTIFIVALFIIARAWKQPRCLSTEEWIKKMLYVYTIEYYYTIKNNDIMKFVGK